MKDIIKNLKKSDTWKNQVTITIKFIYSKDSDEERLMHSKNDNEEIKINGKADEVIEKFFKYKDCDCFFEYRNFKNDLIEYDLI